MQHWGSMEDYTGMAYIREHIPAENDVYRKMRPEWGRLYYPNGELLYEGCMVNNMAYGAGTSYHPYGKRCQEGLFGPNGLICGREYYNNGRIRFEGTYQYNAGFGENWPIFGAYYDAGGNLKYYGAFDIIDEEGGSVRPYVLQPEDYGPVMNPLVTRHYDFCFKGEKARIFYREESPAFRKEYEKSAKERMRQNCGTKEKKAAYLRKGLTSLCPEIRAFSAEELRQTGAWTDQDARLFEETERKAASVGRHMTAKERYERDRRILDVPKDIHDDFLKEYRAVPPKERESFLMKHTELLEDMRPYKWGYDPRHCWIGKPLEERGIGPDNWLRHLDEMTDREISYMLDQQPCIGRLNEERIVYPEATDRACAEFARDF